MPNRKSLDQSEKYDHSSHPMGADQPSDLAPPVEQPGDRRVDRNAVTGGLPTERQARKHAHTGTLVNERGPAEPEGAVERDERDGASLPGPRPPLEH
jgi:hypothetical protein